MNEFLDKAKVKAEEAAGRVGDKVDEVKADGEVKKAEAHRDAVENRNDAKEKLRER